MRSESESFKTLNRGAVRIDRDALKNILSQIEASELEILSWDLEDLERDEISESESKGGSSDSDSCVLCQLPGTPDFESATPWKRAAETQRPTASPQGDAESLRGLRSTRKRVRDAAIAALYPALIDVDLAPGIPPHVIQAAAAIAEGARSGSSATELGLRRLLGGGGCKATHSAKLGIRYRLLAVVNDKEIKITAVIPRESYRGAKVVR